MFYCSLGSIEGQMAFRGGGREAREYLKTAGWKDTDTVHVFGRNSSIGALESNNLAEILASPGVIRRFMAAAELAECDREWLKKQRLEIGVRYGVFSRHPRRHIRLWT